MQLSVGVRASFYVESAFGVQHLPVSWALGSRGTLYRALRRDSAVHVFHLPISEQIRNL